MQKAPFSDVRYRNPPAALGLWTLPPRSLLSAAAHWKTAGKFIFQRGRELASNLLLERIKELKKSIRRLSKHAHSSISRKGCPGRATGRHVSKSGSWPLRSRGPRKRRRMKINYADPKDPREQRDQHRYFCFSRGAKRRRALTCLMDDFTVQIGVDTQRLSERALISKTRRLKITGLWGVWKLR